MNDRFPGTQEEVPDDHKYCWKGRRWPRREREREWCKEKKKSKWTLTPANPVSYAKCDGVRRCDGGTVNRVCLPPALPWDLPPHGTRWKTGISRSYTLYLASHTVASSLVMYSNQIPYFNEKRPLPSSRVALSPCLLLRSSSWAVLVLVWCCRWNLGVNKWAVQMRERERRLLTETEELNGKGKKTIDNHEYNENPRECKDMYLNDHNKNVTWRKMRRHGVYYTCRWG